VDHTSSASSSTLQNAGSIKRQQYRSLVSTMHIIIQKQLARKQEDRAEGVGSGGDRSDYQCTPAFILSAVEAAIATLAAQEQQQANSAAQEVPDVPFRPPRGGFTDVGLHTGSQPKATTCPLLLSVFKVRLTTFVPGHGSAHSQVAAVTCHPAEVHCWCDTANPVSNWLSCPAGGAAPGTPQHQPHNMHTQAAVCTDAAAL
jgi:hypothetical protein